MYNAGYEVPDKQLVAHSVEAADPEPVAGLHQAHGEQAGAVRQGGRGQALGREHQGQHQVLGTVVRILITRATDDQSVPQLVFTITEKAPTRANTRY